LVRPYRPLACSFVALALAAAGCGGDGGGSAGGRDPRAWTVNLCQALSAWGRDIEKRTASLEGQARRAAEERGVPGVREAIVTFADDIVQRSQAMRADVAAAGVPDVEEGANLRRDVLRGLDELAGVFEGFREQLRALPVDDPDAFVRALQEWETRSDAAFTGVERTFDAIDEDYDAPAIEEALAEEKACAFLEEQD
jgi:hypothetical protein